jgi:hypothetical protein
MANKPFMTVQTTIPDSYQLMRKLGVHRDGAVQLKLTDLVLENLPDFMPVEHGDLVAGTHRQSPTRVRVEGPYARFLFFGVTAKGKPVHYDNLNPKGGAHWDRRMVAERGAKIVAELQRYARRRRR